MTGIETELSELGFTITEHVQGRSSIADLFRQNRCGIYVLHFLDGMFYAGQSINVVRRYADHLRNHSDVEKISFKEIQQEQLDAEERRVIYSLESSGFRLRNIEVVTFSYGETDFDLIMPLGEQDRWLDDLTYNDLDGNRVIDDALRSRYTKKFQKFLSQPYASDVIKVLRYYVQSSIPAVRRGEVSFWICSCLPKITREITVCSRISVGWQMTLQAYIFENKLYFTWYLTRDSAEEIFGLSFQDLKADFEIPISFENFPQLEVVIENSPMVKGGQDQVAVTVEGATNALTLMQEDALLIAFRLFNLGLAQKNPCGWSKNHCLDLADRLIE